MSVCAEGRHDYEMVMALERFPETVSAYWCKLCGTLRVTITKHGEGKDPVVVRESERPPRGDR